GIRDGHVTGVQTCALPIYDIADQRRHTAEYQSKRADDLASSEFGSDDRARPSRRGGRQSVERKHAGLFHHARQQRVSLAGHGAADSAIAGNRQRRSALRRLDRREKRRSPAKDRYDDAGLL